MNTIEACSCSYCEGYKAGVKCPTCAAYKAEILHWREVYSKEHERATFNAVSDKAEIARLRAQLRKVTS